MNLEVSRLKSAKAYERSGRLFFFSQSKTTAGLWIEDGPILTTQRSDLAEIEKIVLRCLRASTQGVPHPRQEDWPKLNKAFAQALGASSFNVFAKKAKCISITQDGGIIRIVPTKNEGSKGGFKTIEERSIELAENSDRIGSAVISALDNSE
ncbi:hypothetical protein MPLB_20055 [Mesorhizobium sp. ORS 3324]|nr:hypothetical protein MPLB_20055 [Mesorhizobium sp. ORS 3324]